MAKKSAKAVQVESLPVAMPAVQLIAVDELVANEKNPNEMAAEEFELLVSEIRDVGFIVPIQVAPMNDGTYLILGGHNRWRAAKALGMPKVSCVVLEGERWEEDDLRMLVTVMLNALHGHLNPMKMVELYRKMADKYGENSLQRLFAFTDQSAWEKIVSQVRKGLKKTGMPKSSAKQFDEEVKGAKSVEDLGTVLNHLFNRYGDTLKHSFMVFSYGGREHMYIAMGKRSKKAMDKLAEFCRSWSVDINEIIADVTEGWIEEAEARERESLEAGGKGDAQISGAVVEEEAGGESREEAP